MGASFVVEGDPAAVRERAHTARVKGRSFVEVADALARVSTDGWRGRAAERFWDEFESEPQRWAQAGSAFTQAASALDAWADALARAQAAARAAAAEYARAQQVSTDARAAYDTDVARAQSQAAEAAARGTYLNLLIEPFLDPGQPIRDQAEAAFNQAKAGLDAAAHTCASALRAACTHAPDRRSWAETGLAVLGGAGEALWDLATLAPQWQILTDILALATGELTPEELAARNQLSVEQAGAMLTAAREDPVGFGKNLGKALLDWDTWADDPARAIGHLIPDAVATVLTGGAGAALRGARGLDALTDIADTATDAGRAANGLDTATDLGKLDSLGAPDDLAGLSRLDEARDALTRYDDLPPAPQGVFRSPHDPAVEAWLDEVVARHPELDREGVRGVWDYTTHDGYKRMNGELRGPTDDPAVQARIEATNRGLDQLPPYEGTTYRGTNLPQHVVDEIDAGGPLTDPAFSSSSLDERVADKFIRMNDANPTRITIEGHSGVNVQPFSAAKGEAEILFKGDTKFEVLVNYIGADGVRTLVVREV